MTDMTLIEHLARVREALDRISGQKDWRAAIASFEEIRRMCMAEPVFSAQQFSDIRTWPDEKLSAFLLSLDRKAYERGEDAERDDLAKLVECCEGVPVKDIAAAIRARGKAGGA
jgi:hypothetical protein